MEYIDYGEINVVDEDFFHVRYITENDPDWLIAIRVINGEKNECRIPSFNTKFAVEITVKKNEEYSDEVELPIRSGIDTKGLCLKFHLKDHDGAWKSGYYWIIDRAGA
jgi:hypothetical protein